MVEIVKGYPPLIDKIDAAFNVRGKPVIFSWGDVIYAPHSDSVSKALQMHEAVHGERQKVFVDADGERGISAWWMRYIADPKFRLDEEIPAHRAEYRWHAAQPNANEARVGWRSLAHFHLHHIGSRLSSPLYGSLISLGEAKRLLSA